MTTFWNTCHFSLAIYLPLYQKFNLNNHLRMTVYYNKVNYESPSFQQQQQQQRFEILYLTLRICNINLIFNNNHNNVFKYRTQLTFRICNVNLIFNNNINNYFLKYLTFRICPATIPTMMEVVVDELCSRTVTRIPSIRPTIGFCKSSDWEKTSPACFPAKSRNDVERNSKEQMKK